MNCCCGTASDLYFCVTGRARRRGWFTGLQIKASQWQDGDSVTPHMEGGVFTSASGRFPDLVAK